MITFGNMVKWNIKPSEFGFEYQHKKVIKAQALANFIMKCSFYD